MARQITRREFVQTGAAAGAVALHHHPPDVVVDLEDFEDADSAPVARPVALGAASAPEHTHARQPLVHLPEHALRLKHPNRLFGIGARPDHREGPIVGRAALPASHADCADEPLAHDQRER